VADVNARISLPLLKDRLIAAGVPAEALRPWHTGGGCLTLYVGPEDGKSIVVGPGSSFDPFGTDGYFDTEELYVGDQDESGEGDFDDVPKDAPNDEIVALIVKHCRRIGVVK
jgi:hypothetical protein